MQHVIRIPIDNNQVETGMILHYTWISKVIQKALNKIVDKMKKDIQLTAGDNISFYEITKTFCMIVQQTNNFVFDSGRPTILELHCQNELNLAKKANYKGPLPNIQGILEPESPTGPWPAKCAYVENKAYDPEDTKETFYVEMPLLRKRKTIQSKIVEDMINKMFTTQSIYSLLDMIFVDMAGDAEMFNVKEEDSDEENNKNNEN